MNAPELIRRVARRVPRDLRELRGKLMLEELCEALGVEEVCCPACQASGWLDRAALERCPLCCGFLEVPDRLADWFATQFLAALGRHLLEGRRQQARPRSIRIPRDGRYGRLAHVRYRVHLPALLLDEGCDGLRGGVGDLRPARF